MDSKWDTFLSTAHNFLSIMSNRSNNFDTTSADKELCACGCMPAGEIGIGGTGGGGGDP